MTKSNLGSISTELRSPRSLLGARRENGMSRLINFDTVPDDELKAANTAVVVLNAYTTFITLHRDGRKAFEAAMRAWRERNPNACPEEAPPAVAHILYHNL
jgi:hypothetical protein